MSNFQSTKVLELGSCAFRQPNAKSHCRFLHGYRLQSKLWFGCNELDENNWVVDFGSLKGLKKKFEDQFDHTTCIAVGDPALDLLNKMKDQDMCDLRVMEDGVGIERFAEWCFKTADNYIKSMTNGRCWVDCVEVWEHEKNSAMVGRETIPEQPVESVVIDNNSSEDDRQQELDLRLDEGEPLIQPTSKVTNPNGDPHQSKSSGSWVDPDKVKTTNSWIF